MEKKEGKNEHVDEVNGSCYGKLNLYKVRGQEEYKGVCQYECRLKEACINASRENRENVNLELGYARLENNTKTVISMKSGSGADYICEILRVPEEARTQFIDSLDRLIGLYLHAPQVFENLVRKIFLGQCQADIARLKKISRQAISSRTLRNYAGLAKDIMPEIPKTLTGLHERQVYLLVFEDKLSIREAARKCGLSEWKVWKTKREIASKIAKNQTGAGR